MSRISASEWVELTDEKAHTTYRIDVSWLTSGWECIYGRGCQGVRTARAPELVEGCCSYGAHLRDREERDQVEAWAARLPEEMWQYAGVGRRRGPVVSAGRQTWRTRVVDGACIFLNRPGSAQGPGCALHQWAERDRVAPLTRKPVVCWQVPMRLDYTPASDPGSSTGVANEVVTLTAWSRRHWGAGGAEFAWWCTEDPAAFTAPEPLFRRAAAELAQLLPASVWAALREHLETRLTSEIVPFALPAPRRRRTPTSRQKP